jgi:hypothetical protein
MGSVFTWTGLGFGLVQKFILKEFSFSASTSHIRGDATCSLNDYRLQPVVIEFHAADRGLLWDSNEPFSTSQNPSKKYNGSESSKVVGTFQMPYFRRRHTECAY